MTSQPEMSLALHVASRRRDRASILAEHPGALLLDVTAHGPEPWVRFSPVFPHGGIPVPLSPGYVAASVAGIWEGLKVFGQEDVDPSRFAITAMRGVRRAAGGRGPLVGHRAGVDGDRLLTPRDARHWLFLPSYRWVVEKRLAVEMAQLRRLAASGRVVLLDDVTNGDVDDVSRPLSHAAVLARLAGGRWETSPAARALSTSTDRSAGPRSPRDAPGGKG